MDLGDDPAVVLDDFPWVSLLPPVGDVFRRVYPRRMSLSRRSMMQPSSSCGGFSLPARETQKWVSVGKVGQCLILFSVSFARLCLQH